MPISSDKQTYILFRWLFLIFILAGSNSIYAAECSQQEPVSLASGKIKLAENYFPDTDGVAVHYGNGLAIVGADDQMSGSVVTGSATIFALGVGGQWQQQAELFPQEQINFMRFGRSVAIADNVAMVAAMGQVFIFERGGDSAWTHVFRFINPDPPDEGSYLERSFGTTVDITGDYAFIGDPYAKGSVDEAYELGAVPVGAVHILKRKADGQWAFATTLQSDVLDQPGTYGKSLDANSKTLIVGDENYSGVESRAGAVFVYELDTSGDWAFDNRIDGSFYDYLGKAVSLDCNQLAIRTQDRVEVWTRSVDGAGDWSRETSIPVAKTNSWNTAIAIHADWVLVPEFTRGTNSKVQVFKRQTAGNWTEQGALRSSKEDQFLGLSLSASQGIAVVGSAWLGSAYVFDLNQLEEVDPPITPWCMTGTSDADSDGYGSELWRYDYTDVHEYASCAVRPDWLRPNEAGEFMTIEPAHNLSGDRPYAIDGETAFVETGSADPAVSVYQKTANGWSETQLIATADTFPVAQQAGETPDSFRSGADYRGRPKAIAMSVDGNRAVLGYMWHQWPNENGYNDGFAYVYENLDANGWQRVAELEPQNSHRGRFGMSVALSGDTLAVSGNGQSGEVPRPGKVFIYNKTDNGEWQLQQELLSGYEDWQDQFGVSIAMQGDLLATVTREAMKPAGVLLFKRNSTGEWQRFQKLYTQVEGPNWPEGSTVRVAIISNRIAVESVGTVSLFKQNTAGTWESDRTFTGGELSIDQNGLWAKRVGSNGEVQYLETTIAEATAGIELDTGADTTAQGSNAPLASSGGGSISLLLLILLSVRPRRGTGVKTG